jgi:hypothetical protein
MQMERWVISKTCVLLCGMCLLMLLGSSEALAPSRFVN